MRNSIYGALKNINCKIGMNSDKLATAYVHSVLKSAQRITYSIDPLVDEAQNIYVALDTIGVNTLENSDKIYKKAIMNFLKEENQTQSGTIEDVVLKMFNKNGYNKTMKMVGDILTKLLKQSFDPEYNVPLRSGNIQRYEQKVIKNEFSKFC